MAMNPDVVTDGAAIIAIATDARRGEVYIQRFDAHSLAPLAAPAVLTIAAAAVALGSAVTVIAGSGASAVADAANASGGNAKAILPDLVPDAIDMLFASLSLPISATVAPLYLRPPDAKPPAPSPYSGTAA